MLFLGELVLRVSVFSIRIGLGVLLAVFLSSSALAQGMAPDFSLSRLTKNQDGTSAPLRLSDYRGTVVYLDFWASWCGPCRQSLPALEELQKQYDPENFSVVAINLDETPQIALSFLEDYPVTYTVLYSDNPKVQRSYNLVGLPSSFLIDQRGEIIGSFQGFHPEHIKRLKKAIAYLLEE